jgi:hypothetical protein
MAAVAQNLMVDIPEGLLAQTQSLRSVQVRTNQSEIEIQHNGLLARAERAAREAKDNKVAAAGARKLASTNHESGDLEQSQMYMEDATEYLRKAKDQEQKSKAFREQAEQEEIGVAPGQEGEPVEADLSIVAYMAAALTKSLERKRVTAAVGTLCDKLFSDWTFEPYLGTEGQPLVRYSVALELPVEGDLAVKVTLKGSVKNVYRPRSKAKM